MRPTRFERLLRFADRFAGLFLALVTALVFTSVALRYAVNRPLPDTFDLTRFLLGVTVFWGIASATGRNEHIQIDLLYGVLPERLKRVVQSFASAVTVFVFALLQWQVVEAVLDEMSNNHVTNDLLLPVWPFYALACAALPVALFALVRFVLQASAERPATAVADRSSADDAG